MAGRQPRSGLWIVATHVGTSGFAVPLLCCLIAAPLYKSEALAAWLVWFTQLLGSILGTRWSLSNLRRTAVNPQWTELVVPATDAFCLVLAATFTLTHILRILNGRMDIPSFLLALCALCVIGTIQFFFQTATRFARFEIEDRG